MLPMHVTYLRGENGETSESDDSVISVKGHKRDDRLFPDIPLYCEGYPKPIARGVLHLLCTMLLPFGLRYLIKIAGPNNRIAHIASALYIFTNIWCYGFSALYHVGRWSVQMEILMQKLDHCGVALLSTGTVRIQDKYYILSSSPSPSLIALYIIYLFISYRSPFR